MGQNSAVTYAQAIQAQLTTVCTPTPVYAVFNRNFSTEPTFVTWQLRDVHQPVYTGPQNNKGIDRPVFQATVFAQVMANCYAKAQQIVDALHGYQGNIWRLIFCGKSRR